MTVRGASERAGGRADGRCRGRAANVGYPDAAMQRCASFHTGSAGIHIIHFLGKDRGCSRGPRFAELHGAGDAASSGAIVVGLRRRDAEQG
jgi:hypothetical protein